MSTMPFKNSRQNSFGQKFMMTNMDETDTQALLPEDLK